MKPLFKSIIILLVISASINGSSQEAKQFFKTGKTFVNAGNYQDAIVQFTKAIETDPDYVQAYIERAHVYETLNELQQAADDYNRAIVFKSNSPNLYYDAARLNYTIGNFPTALEMINKALGINAKYDGSYRLLSQVQMAMEDYSNSLISIDKALAIKTNPENYYQHGLVSEKMKNYNQAEIDYGKSIAKDKKYAKAYLALANLQLELNKTDQAMENCNSAFSIEPDSREAYLTRSKIYIKRTEYPKAIDDISKILVNTPNDKELYCIRGCYYQEFIQHQNAINDFTKAIMIDSKYSDAIYNRAYSYEQVGNFNAAIKDYEMLTSLSQYDAMTQRHLDDARKRLFELNRETTQPKVLIIVPLEDALKLKVAKNMDQLSLRGRIIDESEIALVTVNNNAASLFKTGENYEFTAQVPLSGIKDITVEAKDIYENTQTLVYSLVRTEIDPPIVAIIAPYASDNGEIFLDTPDASIYVQGNITDESNIKSILIDGVLASFKVDELNPRFSATINVSNKNQFTVKATDIYGNDSTYTYVLNKEGISLLAANPMGRTWVVFIENSNYETFPTIEGPSKDVILMRSALARYDIQKVIHKKDMSKKEMEKFFSIELRDLLQSNKVNALLIWYAGHGKFINETGYWIPVDAKRDDEFTYFNLNTLKSSLQTYANYVTHNLVITDACESGPTFYQAMRSTPKERNCNDWEAVKFKSQQVFSSAGYELAVDNSQFTKTFANTLTNNPNACIPIESVVNKVTTAVTQNNQQKPKFGKISGLGDEDGTFFFISKP